MQTNIYNDKYQNSVRLKLFGIADKTDRKTDRKIIN